MVRFNAYITFFWMLQSAGGSVYNDETGQVTFNSAEGYEALQITGEALLAPARNCRSKERPRTSNTGKWTRRREGGGRARTSEEAANTRGGKGPCCLTYL